MNRRNIRLLVFAMAATMALQSCKSHYQIDGISRTRVLIDSRYDGRETAEVTEFIRPYKQQVDSVISPVVGHLAKSMSGYRPESPLSNLLADIMVWAAKDYGEKPDMGLYNMGGIRASFVGGTITYGDVLDVAPFENKICFLTLSGDRLLELFGNIASVGGEGVSHGVKMVITKDRKLKSVTLNGKEIDPKGSYRIATLDYLAHGNDRMTALNHKTDFVSPQEQHNDTRYLISNYFVEMERQGIVVDADVEGRIVVSE